jgi:hypothetical protein
MIGLVQIQIHKPKGIWLSIPKGVVAAHTKLCVDARRQTVNGLQALYSSYLTQMLFTVEMKGKREGGCHLMLFVFAHGPLIVEARWVTAAKAR